MIQSKRNLLLSCLLACFVFSPHLDAQADEDLLLTFKGHKGPIYSLAVHPDGNTIATGAEDLLIQLWDPATGEIRKTLEGHIKPVKYLCFSMDGKYLLSAASTDIRIWDLENGGFTKYSKHVTHVYNVNFNKDASRFLSTSLKPKFLEWDRKEAEVINEYEVHDRSCLVADYSPDNTKIASGSLDRTIKIIDAGTGEVIHNISAHGENILSIDFNPDGKLLASASMDKNIKLWNVETGKIHKLLTGHSYAVVYVRFSPDGRYLISASYDGTAKLWEMATGNCIYTYVDHKDALYAADFFPNSEHLATCSNDETVKIFRISPRFFAEYYYFTELQKEMQESGLFEERRKGENKEEYQQRQEDASSFREELHDKYYKMHLDALNKN
ncbi:WD40 repeat domain-containing protein [Bacteroidota bacterium]